MPDWSYRPLFAPWMLGMPRLAHALVLAKMRLIGSTPLLYKIIDLMGHMRPGSELACRAGGMDLASPLGMSAVIDPAARASLAFERFGFGFLEVGSAGSKTGAGALTAERAARALKGPLPVTEVGRIASTLKSAPSRFGVKRFVRLAGANAEDVVATARSIGGEADLFLVPGGFADALAGAGFPFGICVKISESETFRDAGGARLVVLDPDADEWKPADRERGIAAVQSLKRRFPNVDLLYAAGGIEEPRDARQFVEAGAALVSLSHGFVFAGPGTPKRINAALARVKVSTSMDEPRSLLDCAHYAWFWCLVKGAAMTFGALLASYFALTKVILPYDEASSGVTRARILEANPKILHFMAHDRFTLAGTMLSLGLLYLGLAWYGVRHGRRWAQEAVVYSAFTGFLTFFAFVAYGYFDQFHAFVAASMFPIAVQCAVAKALPEKNPPPPDLVNDAAWRRAAVGQLLMVIQAVGLILAGATITIVGGSHVFVETDLTFLGATSDSLRALHANLVPLIAHDRATFGGMLLSSGIAVLLSVLWGFRRGERWLWTTLLIAGLPAYCATLWIHHDIAYTDLLHLSPVFLGLALHLTGLGLSAPYLRGGERP